MAVIPSNPARASKHRIDTDLYENHHRIEGCLSKLEQYGRVATRSEKTARDDTAVVTLATIVLWLR